MWPPEATLGLVIDIYDIQKLNVVVGEPATIFALPSYQFSKLGCRYLTYYDFVSNALGPPTHDYWNLVGQQLQIQTNFPSHTGTLRHRIKAEAIRNVNGATTNTDY